MQKTKKSELQHNPKSKIIKPGYINTYSYLNSKESRQIEYKIKYKSVEPDWEESLVYLSKKFKDLMHDDCVVLDAGCGHGNYVIDENRKMISWAAGIDLSVDFVRKNICLDEVIIADLEKIPFVENEYDGVLSLWVLEHLKTPKKAIQEIHRVLKPGGYVFFTVPNKNFSPILLARVFNLIKPINHAANTFFFGRKPRDIFKAYYRANDIKTIKKLIEGLFEVVELKYNYDPGYTSFNNLTFSLSNNYHKLLSKMGFNCTFAHIVGVLRKV